MFGGDLTETEAKFGDSSDPPLLAWTLANDSRNIARRKTHQTDKTCPVTAFWARVSIAAVAYDSGLASALAGQTISSETCPNVGFRLIKMLGEGGMGVAFYAIREAPEGDTPVVLKVVKPEIVGTAGPTAMLMVQKEAIALGRLNERVPPTPFVVRFVDTGTVVVRALRGTELPWIALEYVHGGTEGTTLEHRVAYSVRNTGFAFDPVRTAHAIECIAEGLTAIHDVAVVHRDLTPGNVLCCGFGSTEVLKIADFGIARPTGIAATFGGVLLGTPGYAAPEQSFASEGDVGPSTDVFSFACVVYFVLTGEQYFNTPNFAQALLMAREIERRSIIDARSLSPELRENPAACRSIDQLLAHATVANPAERPRSARVLASSLLGALRSTTGPRSQRASERLVQSVATQPFMGKLSSFDWIVRHPPGDDRLVRSVAWDGDGHCLAVTTDGLHFWNGTKWLRARTGGFERGQNLHTVSLVRPGQWLVGGENGFLAVLGSDDGRRVIRGPTDVSFTHASGDPDELAVVVGERPGAPPLLFSVAAGRFFRPAALDAARTVASIARVDDSRWLIAGRTTLGSGFAAVYSALDFDGSFLPVPPTDALTTCAGHLDRGFGLAAGRQGVTLRYEGRPGSASTVEGGPDLACSAMDVQGRAWVGAAGRLWSQGTGPQEPWISSWQDATWTTPFVSLHADIGLIVAVTVDGAVVEGRA
jgi:eukaryotic-like serine/threonine-protein kinase